MLYTRNKKFQMLKIAQRADRLLRSRWLNVVPLFILLSICCLLGAILYLMDVSRQVERNAVLSKDALWVEQALRFELSAIQERARAFNDAAFNQNTLSRADKVRQFARTNSAVVDVSFANDEELLSSAVRGTASSNPKLEARALAARLSKVSDQATTTDPYDDVDRAGESIVDLIIPLRSTESNANLLLVSISLQRFLDIQVPWWISQRYGVSLTTTGGNVVAAKDHLPASDVEEEYRISFDPPLRNMYLSLQLRRAVVGFSGILLVAGFIGSGLFSMALVIATYFHLQNRVAAERHLAEAHAFRKAMEDSITIGMRARDL
jgi:two-component system sensor histidine kinase DctS